MPVLGAGPLCDIGKESRWGQECSVLSEVCSREPCFGKSLGKGDGPLLWKFIQRRHLRNSKLPPNHRHLCIQPAEQFQGHAHRLKFDLGHLAKIR
mmetsp:Transcript_40466/g.81099  ORF Transcript_40466/g.81099 Transcript_40466/m.81099 type:complete len:95 (+) Transcript_40466:68-352(+)